MFQSIVTWFSDAANQLTIATFLLVVVTFLLVCATKSLNKTAKMQFLGSMAAAFQDDWNSTWSMRFYLHSDSFENDINNAISRIYKTGITYKDIASLSNKNNLISSNKHQLRNAFNTSLNSLVGGMPFTPFEALNRVMLCLDRILILKDDDFFYSNFMVKYKPPVKNLKPFLEGYIVIEQTLRDDPHFKEDLLNFLNS